MSQVIKLGVPDDELYVISRLKVKPKDVKITTKIDMENSSVRQWVEISYEFRGKFTDFGKFLEGRVADVAQAGGFVKKIVDVNLTSEKLVEGDASPKGKWCCLAVKFWITTQYQETANYAAMVDYLNELFGKK